VDRAIGDQEMIRVSRWAASKIVPAGLESRCMSAELNHGKWSELE
jgi:hypothetical protein